MSLGRIHPALDHGTVDGLDAVPTPALDDAQPARSRLEEPPHGSPHPALEIARARLGETFARLLGREEEDRRRSRQPIGGRHLLPVRDADLAAIAEALAETVVDGAYDAPVPGEVHKDRRRLARKRGDLVVAEHRVVVAGARHEGGVGG